MIRRAFIVCLVLTTILLASCIRDQPRKIGTPEMPMTADRLAGLYGKELELVRLVQNGSPVTIPSGKSPTLTFIDKTKAGGFAGVNRYSGEYQFSNGAEITWSGPGFIATKMAGPPERMALEDRFLATLGKTKRVGTVENRVILSSEDDQFITEFQRPAN